MGREPRHERQANAGVVPSGIAFGLAFYAAAHWIAGPLRHFDEVMTFRPAHSLAAHRPLGGIMRARLQVYKALSAFRHRENGIDEQNTPSVDQIPA